MGAPNRVIFRVGDTDISAFLLPDMPEPEARRITCKECAPQRTKMVLRLDAVVPMKLGNIHYYIFQCGECGRQWAAPFYVTNAQNEAK